MSKVIFRKFAVLLALGSVLVACGGNQSDSHRVDQVGTAPSAPQASDDRQVASLTFESISVGNYVEAGTFAVGGVSSQFNVAAPLFASVKWVGNAADANLVVKLLDSVGNVIAEKPAAPLTTTQTSTNFVIRGIPDAQLAAGAYHLDVYANNAVVMGADITIVD